MRRLDRNRLALGLFGANCSGGLAITTAPERWEASWDNNLALARMADAAGLDFMLPLGRWKGYGGVTDHNGSNFETLTWAAGILASTRDIMAFGTLHVPLYNPVVAAKQMTTVDHVGRGRFGLNIVCGWNQDEFDMLGVDLDQHDRRYDQGEEWVTILVRAWESDEPFDFAGEFYRIRKTVLKPRPYGASRPMLVSAAFSERGRTFAARNADMLFTVAYEPAKLPANVRALKAAAAAHGRTVGVFTNVYVVCRPTRREAEDYHHYYAVEHADRDAVEAMVVGRGLDGPGTPEEARRTFRLRAAGGNGALPVIGTPDEVARHMIALQESGVDALAMGFANYLQHFPYFRDEVLPRLARAGLRTV
ncbi:MAG: LLM class flavin-dependent oxidoreductase [Alphaproteobacteria bacterium]|nr:LLM class flavin-dependent oxidoreductase [Alphaproteobacteria bacterium]